MTPKSKGGGAVSGGGMQEGKHKRHCPQSSSDTRAVRHFPRVSVHYCAQFGQQSGRIQVHSEVCDMIMETQEKSTCDWKKDHYLQEDEEE